MYVPYRWSFSHNTWHNYIRCAYWGCSLLLNVTSVGEFGVLSVYCVNVANEGGCLYGVQMGHRGTVANVCDVANAKVANECG